jgi:hypothetical protein
MTDSPPEMPEGWPKGYFGKMSDEDITKRFWQYTQFHDMQMYRYGVFELINEITRIVLAYPTTAQMKQLHDGLAAVTRDFKHVQRPSSNDEKSSA